MAGKSEDIDVTLVRTAVRDVVDTSRYDDWLMEVPDHVLIHMVAPLEMLQFQYFLDPPQDRHLVRAARVACEALSADLEDCPADMAQAFRALNTALTS